MKKIALLLAAGAMTLTSTLAAAQPGRDNRGSSSNRGNDYRGNDSRYDGRGDNRGSQQWRTGQRLDDRYRSRDRVVTDYNRYRLRPPPRGYSYYRTDNGDIVMAAIATGIIGLVVGSLLSDNNNNNNGYGNSRPYDDGYYGSPSYGPGYGGGQIWYDRYGRPYTVDRYGRSVWVN